MTHTSARTVLHAAILGSALAAAASAQPASSTPPADILSGPKVQDRETPGVPSQFGEEMDPRQRTIRTPHEVFMRAVRSLEDESTPADARLTPEQRSQIEAIAAEQQQKNREFMKANMEELRALREQTGVRRNAGADAPQRPAAGPNLSDAERAKLIARLQELESARPSADAAHTQIFAALNPAQQTLVRTQIDQWTDQQVEQRAMQRLESLKAQRAADKSKDAGAERTLPDDKARVAMRTRAAERLGLDPAKLEQIRERLSAPPTSAEKGVPYLERLTARIDDLPADLATPDQKDKLKAFLLERAEQRRNNAS